MKKCAEFAGADNLTPSVPQYFSWINNTNEGATEAQTLVNLAFFKWMQDTYGMQIRIYAWDAGNFDGASEGYGNLNGEKFKGQYPEGYKNVVEAAKKLGIRLGLWGSPDGFGDDEKTERERFDFYVHLCKDYHFAQFKIDGVCGQLRPEKAKLYAEMLRECRKYSPDLIVLNHRLRLYEAEQYVTTYLWNGEETYTDVFAHNGITAMHNRAYMFSRGHTQNLERLAEDHGVCLSSSLDYFEDDLVYQAFSRCLILAPEIYGNPWFLKDTEFAKLARIYNLHARYAPILVNGIKADDALYGCNAVSRGNGCHRFICTGNDTWQTKEIEIELNETVGITEKGEYAVNLRHPYETRMGVYRYGERVKITLLPFRATLIELVEKSLESPVIEGAEYEVIKEDANGAPKEIRVLKANGGELFLLNGERKTLYATVQKTDIKEKPPVLLCALSQTDTHPENAEQLYEASVFAADNDCLEARCIKRSGDTRFQAVSAARDAFFAQKVYKLRGCEAKNMFDGDETTFFDGISKTYAGGMRINGGCLRIDFGEQITADTLEITYFSVNRPTKEVPEQNIPCGGDFSLDLKTWTPAPLFETKVTNADYQAEIVKYKVHTTYMLNGKMLTSVYRIDGSLRYWRLPEPMDRIYSVKLIKNGKAVVLHNPHANNLQAHYLRKSEPEIKSESFVLPEDIKDGDYLALALNGEHENESAYACLRLNGELTGFGRRAPDFRGNVWEHVVCDQACNYTYYHTLKQSDAGKNITVYAVFNEAEAEDMDCKVYLCPKHE